MPATTIYNEAYSTTLTSNYLNSMKTDSLSSKSVDAVLSYDGIEGSCGSELLDEAERKTIEC